jgi:hypothetical protein
LAIFLKSVVSDSYSIEGGNDVNSSVGIFDATTVMEPPGLDGVAVDFLDPGTCEGNTINDVDEIVNTWLSIGQMC